MESKWIDFIEGVSTGKTKIFEVTTKDTRFVIATIKWYGPWRKYSFFPREHTIYETQCLQDIVSFINKLMLERKVDKQNSKL